MTTKPEKKRTAPAVAEPTAALKALRDECEDLREQRDSANLKLDELTAESESLRARVVGATEAERLRWTGALATRGLHIADTAIPDAAVGEFHAFAVRAAVLSAREDNSRVLGESARLSGFKKYVHDRLDAMGVPVNPDPTANAVHGCRIEGRLNWLQARLPK